MPSVRVVDGRYDEIPEMALDYDEMSPVDEGEEGDDD